MISNIFNFFKVNKSLAIDLGTSNVLIYDKQKKAIVLNEPSVIVRDKKTRTIVAVGSEARQMIGKNPDTLEVIKPLKEGVISDLDAARDMLYTFIKRVYGLSPFKPDIMLCVPIEVTTVEKRALFESVTGAKKIYLIEEGRAAIIGSGTNISLPTGSMVIDIGGGSTDVAVLSLNEIVVSRSIRIAGNSLDKDIIRYVKENLNLAIGDRTAEKIKKEIGTAIELNTSQNNSMTIKGRHLITNIPCELNITANQVREAIMPSLQKILDSVKEVLSKCPPEIATDILDNGIVLTGGGAYIKYLDEYIENNINVPVIKPEKPLESVVIGAGLAFDNRALLKTLLMREN
ncbi:rod shape-determining protein [Oceanivirga salmonicida]|uniref:rod shape-determining protein n=1 Tax=Oceanivirga salmonicida TaxID=1769291 RepID=UPI0008349483|nr:rod shape-determining protein [Oceanivirga salmonicida]